MRTYLLAGLIVLVAVSGTPGHATWADERMARAVAAYEAGDYHDAVRGFRRLASHGSAVAETMLGIMYGEGRGLSRRPSVAVAYFYRAACRGYGPAQIALSDAYSAGRGIAPDTAEAYFWAKATTMFGDRMAAAEGEARANRLRKLLDPEAIAEVEKRLLDWRPRAIRRR